jgi:UDP-N-acetylglucosamine diphosphorylase / glucose-1-phosphate thymidylyltransferase / UDP-N-acetylgalactosamine diphosphorylase / glucosamine-1-phosphate N-acetyltransferase / galactosamine-1-phosphate N-acetyltransferase
MSVRVAEYIAGVVRSTLAHLIDRPPWHWTTNASAIVRDLVRSSGAGFEIADDVAIHQSARVESGATIKGPALVGPECFIASTALIRGGCWLDRGCIVGPAAELKTSFMFAGSKLAHLNFVGDSVLGADVNIEAGAMIANYRNECADKRIRIGAIDTGVEKFGALVGDGVRIGANAVIAPGALLAPGTIIPRLGLVDQS